MSAPLPPVSRIIGVGIAMGVAADYLLRGSDGLGVNGLLLFLGLAASVWIVSRRAATRIGPEAMIWIGVAILCAVGFVWRGSPTLRALSFAGAATAFTIPALDAGREWVRRAGVTELLEAVGGSALFSLLGSLRLLSIRDAASSETATPPKGGSWRLTGRALTGVLLAIPPVLIFGGLFMSADEVFAGIVEDFVSFDLDELASHVLTVGILAWLACGYLTGFLSGTRLDAAGALRRSRPPFGAVEVCTALALVDLLFLGFVSIQFRYLFGGADVVRVTPDLTYAAYAREGFFQLVIAAALVVPWLLSADWLLGTSGAARPSSRSLWMYRSLAAIQLFLLLAIVASALQRMQAYQDTYGLTEPRLLATAFLMWVSAIVVWFGGTVLVGRRTRFAFGALMSGFALLAILHALNPDALIARWNFERAVLASAEATGPGSGPQLDVDYLTSLGSDAVPALLGGLVELDGASRCRVARRLLRTWGPRVPTDWRSWNWSVERARALIGADSERLRRFAPRGSRCGPRVP